MASHAQFQLFPPPLPKINTAVDPNPFRRAKSQSAGQGASFPLQTIVKSPDAETVIIQIIEEPSRVQPLPRARIAPIISQSPGGRREAEAGNNAAIHATSSLQSLPPPPPRAPMSSHSTSPTPIRSSSPSGSQQISPTVPMRSMFPTYNPSLRLSQQPYYPQRGASLHGQVTSREDYSPQLASPSQLDEIVGGAKTAPSSVLEFPMDDVMADVPKFSSSQELDRLWEATNGQDPDSVLPAFDLQMSR
jgi:hypothetical protein